MNHLNKKVTRVIKGNEGDLKEEAQRIVERELLVVDTTGEIMANENEVKNSGLNNGEIEDVFRGNDDGRHTCKIALTSDVGFGDEDVMTDDFINSSGAVNDAVERDDVDGIAVPASGLTDDSDGVFINGKIHAKIGDEIGEHFVNRKRSPKVIGMWEIMSDEVIKDQSGEMNTKKGPVEGKIRNLSEVKRVRNITKFQEKFAQNPKTGDGKTSSNHSGDKRNTATSKSIWMKTWMMILSSIWLLRLQSEKTLVMVVLVNVLSSTFSSIPVVGAENTKPKEKGVTPVFLEPVPNVTVSVGRDASLTCTVDHLGMHKVAWIHLDRQMILSIHNHVITRTPRFGVTHDSHKTWTLHVTEVKEEDRGHYMCQVNTKPMISQTGFLQVVVPPNILDEESSPSSIVVREKDEVTLTCQGEGFPVPHIKWRREDGRPIETFDGRKVGHLDGSTLPLHQVSRIDMGAYLCIASNGVPPSVSKRITLDVEFAPQMHVPNQLVGAPLSTEVHLECFVEAHPRAITYWEFRDAMVMNTSRITTDTLEDLYRIHMILTIRDLQDSDFGTYKCISKNSIAETDGSITLNKTYRPTSPPQTMLHSSDDEGKPHQTRGRHGKDQQRKQLEASRRRFQEEEADKRQEEDSRRRTQETERQKYDHDLNQGYRDDKTTRISNPPIDSGVGVKQLAISAICWLGLHALPLL